MKQILETERLIVRELGEQDAQAFHAFNSHPEVMRFTGETPSASVDEARRRLREYPDYARYGFGRWGVVYKPDDRVIGFNGLKFLDDLDEVDLGYRFLPEYWGRGIATESSLAIVRYGFETLGLERIIALVLPDNAGSIRVLEKVGMRFERMIEYCGESAQRWAIESSRTRATREDAQAGRHVARGS